MQLSNKMSFLKQAIKKTLNLAGLDILRAHNNPENTLLGLKKLPIMTIIDVGANTGQSAKKFIKCFPQAHIYCFEPLPQPFKELNEWAQKQEKRVTVYNFALGEQEGASQFFYHQEFSPSSSFLKTTEKNETYYPFTKKQKSVTVEVTTLDDWMKRFSIDIIAQALIKIDAQGYDDRVIRGGKEIFTKIKYCIVEINLDLLYEGQATFKDIVLLLDEFGLGYAGNLNQTYTTDGHTVFIDALFIKP